MPTVATTWGTCTEGIGCTQDSEIWDQVYIFATSDTVVGILMVILSLAVFEFMIWAIKNMLPQASPFYDLGYDTGYGDAQGEEVDTRDVRSEARERWHDGYTDGVRDWIREKAEIDMDDDAIYGYGGSVDY